MRDMGQTVQTASWNVRNGQLAPEIAHKETGHAHLACHRQERMTLFYFSSPLAAVASRPSFVCAVRADAYPSIPRL